MLPLIREAANRVYSVVRPAGVITSSTGNHGLEVAAAAKVLGSRC
jgi:threonine dehydratase